MDINRECVDAKEFGLLVRARIHANSSGYEWDKDIKPWMHDVLNGCKFGDTNYCWTVGDAIGLADEFINEASTW